MYSIEYVKDIKKDIKKLVKKDRSAIKFAIETHLRNKPFIFGKPLRYSLKGLRSMRVGNYRIIFQIKSKNKILIVKIGHRKDVYKQDTSTSY